MDPDIPTADANPFAFQPSTAARIPRAWERKPATPHASRRKGHKIWKRINVGPDVQARNEAAYDNGGDARGTKRQRLQQMPAVPAVVRSRHQAFVHTAREQSAGTPKRKASRRQSLRTSLLHKALQRSPGKTIQHPSPGKQSLSLHKIALGNALELQHSPTKSPRLALAERSPNVNPRVTANANDLIKSPLRPISTDQNPMAVQEQDPHQRNATLEILASTEHDEGPAPEESGKGHDTVVQFSGLAEQVAQPTEQEINVVLVEDEAGDTSLVLDIPQVFSAFASEMADKPDPQQYPRHILPSESAAEITVESSGSDDGGASAPDCNLQAEDTSSPQSVASPEKTSLVEVGLQNLRTLRPRRSSGNETEMLRNFVSRVQAQKLAASELEPPQMYVAFSAPQQSPEKVQASPRRSPRRHRASNAPETRGRPSAPASPVRRPVPALKIRTMAASSMDEDDELAEPSPVKPSRRSTRAKKPPSVSKVERRVVLDPTDLSEVWPQQGPSRIPMRRADGSEPVRIAPSAAQALATVTRTNTRRNRGQAQMPRETLAALEVIAATRNGAALTPIAKRVSRPRACKQVDWDDTLVYFGRDASDVSSAAARGLMGLSEGEPAQRVSVRIARGMRASAATAPEVEVDAATSRPGNTPGARRTARVLSTSTGTPSAPRMATPRKRVKGR